MTYFAPYIDTAGLHLPLYQDIEDYYVQQAQNIFGSDIYLANDSQDFQMIAAMAKTAYDTMQALQLIYNSQSPATAISTGLDNVVAINGVVRKGATYSTASVTLTGTAYTVINNGVVADINGNLWNLPASVTIGAGGTVTTTATAQSLGSITALANQITSIQTPTYGWTSVTNPTAAAVGTDAEVDSSLRARQADSVANPSQALTTGVLGAVLAVANVTNAAIYENDTNVSIGYINNGYNPGGFPPHSITVVTQGGDGQTIANAIGVRKTPGCYTDGDQTYNYTDQYNVVTPIRFFLNSQQTIDVSITINPLTNYTSAIGDIIVTNVVNYLNTLEIGQNVVISELWQAAVSANTAQYPYFSIKTLLACIHGGTLAATDITINFNQQAVSTTSNVTVTVFSSAPNFQFMTKSNTQNLPLI